jgi:hypothetical protein
MVMRANDAYITDRSVPDRLAALGVPLLVIFGTAHPAAEEAGTYPLDLEVDYTWRRTLACRARR